MPAKKVARKAARKTVQLTFVRVRATTRLAPADFKAEVARRGWTYRALAHRWGVTEGWVSKVARNEERALYWDDAVRGLPQIV